MNQDDSEIDMQNGFSRYNLNCRIGSSGSDSVGAIENVVGNNLVFIQLPDGNNTTIGAYNYKLKNKVYYFNYNDQGNHSILEYNHNTNTGQLVITSSILNFDPKFLITGINVIDLDNLNDLLYWVERKNPPRKINIQKALKYTNPIRFTDNTSVGTSFSSTTLGFKFTGVQNFTVGQKIQVIQDPGALNPSYNGDFYVVDISIPNVVAVNQQFLVSSPVNPGTIYDLTNGYHFPLTEDVIDQIKYPALEEPKAVYKQDSTQEINFLSNKLIQYKAQYVYDDFERSAWSPISVNTVPPVVSTSKSVLNQYNAVDITVPKGGNLVRRLRISARFGNTGDFFLIVDDKVDQSTYFTTDSNGNYVYRFKNDGSYPAIDLTDSIKLFDNVPLIAGAQEFIAGNRLVEGDITEGFDQVDINAQLDVTYQDSPSNVVKTINIKGRVRIQNPFLFNDAMLSNNEPIHNYGSGTVFGGIGVDNGVFGDDWNQHLTDHYLQSIPLGGFTAYLAGTSYYGVSIQSPIAIYDSSTQAKRNLIRTSAFEYFNEFIIPNVPPGKYFLRFASHLTTQADIDSGEYQNTSTYAFSVAANTHDTAGYEIEIDYDGTNVTTPQGQGFINFDGSTLELYESKIMDPSGFDYALDQNPSVLCGYIVDKEGVPAVVTADLLAQKKISRANVLVVNPGQRSNVSGTPYNGVITYAKTLDNWPDQNYGIAKTDHNGFFFYAALCNTFFPLVQLFDIHSGQYSMYPSGSIKDGYLYTSVPLSHTLTTVPIGQARIGVYQNLEPNVTSFSRTHITGTILDQNGLGVSGMALSTSSGDTQITDPSGEFDIIEYAETDFNAPIILSTNIKMLINPSIGNLSYSLNKDNDYFSYFISSVNYNNTTFPPPDNITATISPLAVTTAALKRGGIYNYGLVYYDRGNRSGTVNTDISLRLPIAFYTEPENGVLNPTGLPSVFWTIQHIPPIWATHYQWVRTVNSAQNNYVQWAAKEVHYVDAAGGASNQNDGTQIKISIDNMFSEYKTQNPDSIITYDFAAGDRIRLITDSTSNFFTNYYDVKITKFDANYVYIQNFYDLPEIKSGTTFELYTPKLTNASEIYYEIGEYYEIGNPGTGQRYHKGQTQNQTPNLQIPAEGTFQGGDVYYRSRVVPILNGVTIGYRSMYVDDYNFSDFFISKFADIGRPNIVDKDAVQVNRYSTIRYSGQLIPETKINGLNNFIDIDFETYERLYGKIYKLFSINENLDCYQAIKCGKILVNKNVIYDSFGSGTVGASQSVLSPNMITYTGDFGTQNPESFAEYGGIRYFYDKQKGAVLQLAGDGITPISSAKMNDFFRNITDQYLSFNEVPVTWGSYDKEFNEYVISFRELTRTTFVSSPIITGISIAQILATLNLTPPGGSTYSVEIATQDNGSGGQIYHIIYRDIINGQYIIDQNVAIPQFLIQDMKTVFGFTLGFSTKTNFWTSFYSYQPECMTSCGISLITFQGGKCFLHNTNQTRNNFYGIGYPTQSWIVFNNEDQKQKVYNAIGEEATSIWSCDIITKEKQESNLITEDFEQDNGGGLIFSSEENIRHAGMWMDQNTPNVPDPLINGDPIRSSSVIVKFNNDSTTKELMYAALINFEYSERSGK